MSITWKKLGRVFKADSQHSWMDSHTTPIAAVCLDDRIRLYFSTRPKPDHKGNYVSLSSFLDVDRDDPTRILMIHNRPILPLGAYGTFDEFGVMVTDVVREGDRFYLYYAGWQR